uniref:Uncharacterized protein n=1 Tax=Maylandia zebra TaxID=106582 RepID=A0A3P9BI74_9CICH
MDSTTIYSFHTNIFAPVYRSEVLHYLQVYTINLESRYLMVQGLFALYGAVDEYRPLDEYPAEEFTEVYFVKFQKLSAKRHMGEKSFYGGKEDTQEEPSSSEKTTTSDDNNLTRKQTSGNDNRRETSNISCYLDFTLLLLPPQEHHYYGPKSQHRVLLTEDKIGTLHNTCADTRQNPKGKMEEAEEPSITVSGHNEPLIGPKRPHWHQDHSPVGGSTIGRASKLFTDLRIF